MRRTQPRRVDGFGALISAGERWALAYVYGAGRSDDSDTASVLPSSSSSPPPPPWRTLGVAPLPPQTAARARRATHDVPIPEALLGAVCGAEDDAARARGNPERVRTYEWPRRYVEQVHRRLELIERHWRKLCDDAPQPLPQPQQPSGSWLSSLPAASAAAPVMTRRADVVRLSEKMRRSLQRPIVVQNLVHTTYWSTTPGSSSSASLRGSSALRYDTGGSVDDEMVPDEDGEDGDNTNNNNNRAGESYYEAAAAAAVARGDTAAAVAAALAEIDYMCSQRLDLHLIVQRAGHLWPQLGTVQLNKVIVRYVHAWAATHVFFDKARIYETGGCEHARAERIVRHTLSHVSDATGVSLHVRSRVCQNTVATLHLTYPLFLPLLRESHATVVTLPDDFTGAVVELPNSAADLAERPGRRKPKIKALAFSSGQIVFIGARTLERVARAAESLLWIVEAARDTPANRVEYQRLCKKKRGRKDAVTGASSLLDSTSADESSAAASSSAAIIAPPYRPPRGLQAVSRSVPEPAAIATVPPSHTGGEEGRDATSNESEQTPARRSLKRSAGQEMLRRVAKRQRLQASVSQPWAIRGQKGTRLIS